MLAASVGWRTPWRTRRKIPAHEPFYSGLENRYPSLGGSRVRIPPLPVTKRFLGRGHLGTACDGSRNRNAQSVDVHGRLLKSTGFVRHRRSAGPPRRLCSFSALLDRPRRDAGRRQRRRLSFLRRLRLARPGDTDVSSFWSPRSRRSAPGTWSCRATDRSSRSLLETRGPRPRCTGGARIPGSRRPDSNRGPLHYEFWAAVTTSHQESPHALRRSCLTRSD
jgi:hypothetical protein